MTTQLTRDFVDNERGTVAVLFGVSILAVLAAGGIAISYSIAFNARTKLQNALDSAVLAGTILPGMPSDEQRTSHAKEFFAGNSAALIGNKDNPSIVIRITGDPVFAMQSVNLTGDVQAEIYNPLGAVVGDAWMPVAVHAAARKMRSAPACVLGLDETQPATIDFNGQAELEAKNCVVQANSSSGSGIRQVGQPFLKAKAIGVTGKATGDGYDPPPTEGTAPILDPYADLQFPASTACDPADKGTKIQGDTVTLEPGTYCGGLTLMAGAVVTFNPGVYVFKNGPLWLISGAVARGEDVVFAFTGKDSTLYMNGSAELHVTSPRTGTYKNIQFFGDPANGGESPWGACVIGNITLEYDGAMYLPGQNIWFAGGSTVIANSPSYAIVGDKIWIQDHTKVTVTQENRRNLEGFIEATGFGFGATLTH